MKKYFQTFVKKYQVIPKSSIYDEYAKHLISEFNKHEATLYFIVKTKKVSFVPGSFRPVDNYGFVGDLRVGEKIHQIRFNCAKIHFDDPKVKEQFPTLNEFCDHCMSDWKIEKEPNLSNEKKYTAIAHVNTAKSSEERLVINCPLGVSLAKGKGGQIIVTPYQLIMFFDIDCLEELEIIYIGKSNDNLWRRIYNHNKWGVIEEHRDQATEDLIVYFMQIEPSAVDIGFMNRAVFIQRQEANISIEDATLATEAVLISHFISEKRFNSNHVGLEIKDIQLIQTKLKSIGFSDICVEVDLDGLFGVLGTKKAGYKRSHRIEAET